MSFAENVKKNKDKSDSGKKGGFKAAVKKAKSKCGGKKC